MSADRERGFTLTAKPTEDGAFDVTLQISGTENIIFFPGFDLKTALLEALAWYEPLLAVELGADATQVLRKALAGWTARG